MQNEKIPHILNTSANLFGICLVIITGLHLSSARGSNAVYIIVLFGSLIFLSSCILSYLSIRDEKDTIILEHIADYLFLGGLILLFMAMATLALNLI